MAVRTLSLGRIAVGTLTFSWACAFCHADVLFDDFSGLPISGYASGGSNSALSGAEPGIAAIAGLDRRRWIAASHSITLTSWGYDPALAYAGGTEPGSGSASIQVGGGSAAFGISIFQGDDGMVQTASSMLEYRAQAGQSFDLSAYRSIKLMGIGANGLSKAAASFSATVVSAAGTVTQQFIGLGTNAPMGEFELNLWEAGGGAIDTSAIYSISVTASGLNTWLGAADYASVGGAYLNYTMSGIALAVPAPAPIAMLGSLVFSSWRRRR
jgi:hypothetical protein